MAKKKTKKRVKAKKKVRAKKKVAAKLVGAKRRGEASRRSLKRSAVARRGRPSTYKPEYARKFIEFFDVEPFEDMELPHYFDNEKHRVKWTDYKRVASKLPTLRDFAKSIKVSISTVYDWLSEKHGSFQKEFSDAFTHAKEIRKDFLIQNALQGLYPPLTFKFVAVNLTDMRDKEVKDVNIGGQEGNPIEVVMFSGKKARKK